MSDSFKMIIVLTVIAILSGGILAVWDAQTSPLVEKHRIRELKEAISEVLPKYDFYEEKNIAGTTVYIGKKNGSESPVGIAFGAIGSGFQGKISMMVGITPDFSKLTGIKVLEQIETPGLGSKISSDPTNKNDPFWFSSQFNNVLISPEISVVKNMKPSNPNEIQAITGATISSKAVVRILNESINNIRKKYKD